MKKIYFSFILVCTIFLISCGDININTKTNITKKGSATVLFKIEYNEIAGEIIEDNFNEYLGKSNVKINKYTKGDKTTEEIEVYVNNLHELTTNENLKKLFNYKITKQDYFYKSVYTFEIRPGSDVFNIIEDYKNKTSNNYINNIPFENTLSFQGKLINTNANKIINENEVIWSYKLGQLNNNTVMKVEFKIDTLGKPIILIIGAIVLVIIIIIGLKIKKERKRTEVNSK